MIMDTIEDAHLLPQGYCLGDRRLIRVLTQNAVGVTYLAEPVNGGDPEIIKEFLPLHLAIRVGEMVQPRGSDLRPEYERRLQTFLDDSAKLASMRGLIAIEPVIAFFAANGTGYRVLSMVSGTRLDDYIASLARLPGEEEIRALLLPLLDTLTTLHSHGIYHRDISPQTIQVQPDGVPVLMDFEAMGSPVSMEAQARVCMTLFRPGFTPYECVVQQGRQGAWSDIYGLGAVAYWMITGAPPPDALRRRLDMVSYIPASGAGSGAYSSSFLAAIDWAVSPETTARPQTAEEWRAALAALPSTPPLTSPSTTWRDVHSPMMMGAVSVALAMVIGLGVLLWSFHQGKSLGGLSSSQHGPAVVDEDNPENLRTGSVFRDCTDTDAAGTAICPQMVVIPPGTFRMGSPSQETSRHSNEGPQHKVSIAYLLAIGRFPITFAQWDACVLAGGCAGYSPTDKSWGRAQRPVINVSWNDAHHYVTWLSQLTGQTYRLPSESEWEYAARAGSAKPHYWGIPLGHNMANCNGCGSLWDGKQTAPVGSFPPNSFGVFDMLGNVWQWVEDCYHDGYNNAPTDGSPWLSGSWLSGGCGYRVLRGGSWFSNANHLRLAYRGGSSPSYRGNDSGFRVVRQVVVDTAQ